MKISYIPEDTTVVGGPEGARPPGVAGETHLTGGIFQRIRTMTEKDPYRNITFFVINPRMSLDE